MTMHCNWNYPTAIRVGADRLFETTEILQQSHFSHPFVVVDPFIRKQVYFSEFLTSLNVAIDDDSIFDSFSGNPNETQVMTGVHLLREKKHDCVIVIGGGSAIDVAKCIALIAKQNITLWELEDVDDNYLKADNSKILPIIAIPTTAGTGSEVGRAAVITDTVKQTKRLIFHPKMLPIHVILDPKLTLSIPPHLTAATGMDAFAHNLEAFLAPGTHPMADGIALEGCRLIIENLPLAFNDGNNINARQNLLIASMMGATAFQKGLGLIHALSHPVGAVFDLHHGLLNALFMPYSLNFKKEIIEDKCCRLANHLGIKNPSQQSLLEFVITFIRALNLPLTLKELEINQDAAELIAIKAVEDPSCKTDPRPLTQQDLQQIFLNAYSGKELSIYCD